MVLNKKKGSRFRTMSSLLRRDPSPENICYERGTKLMRRSSCFIDSKMARSRGSVSSKICFAFQYFGENICFNAISHPPSLSLQPMVIIYFMERLLKNISIFCKFSVKKNPIIIKIIWYASMILRLCRWI